ncbi:MAG: FKBP-type peptidyl-prolyl cis-trans isomerase [Sphingobacteriales bacterium JAD_PAG50586_3]|nr:MAG: FKBP-type peptidyl-prolyl cis-trans isomerase [Sphingobacteriales bacterium JAD_PAG50586_3]
MKQVTLVVFIVFAMLGSALAQPNANKGYTKTPTGTLYKFIKTNKKAKMPVEGQVLFLSLEVRTEKPDTLLFTSADIEKNEGIPYYEMFAKPTYKGDYSEILALMHVGDSVVAKFDADTFFQYVYKIERADVPFKVDSGHNVVMRIKLNSIMEMDSFKVYMNKVQADKDRKASDTETKNIGDFITTNNITVPPTASGLYYIETKAGSGDRPMPGDSVKLKYTGMFIDGSVFDSNEDIDNMAMVTGVGMVIPGFDEAVQLMQPGAEATVIIPYRLGYGPQGYPPVIPPFSTLIFNLRLVSVTKNK